MRVVPVFFYRSFSWACKRAFMFGEKSSKTREWFVHASSFTQLEFLGRQTSLKFRFVYLSLGLRVQPLISRPSTEECFSDEKYELAKLE